MTKADRHQLDPTPVRIPEDLKAALKAEATTNERSLNGEIVHRLRSSFKSKRASTTQQPKGSQQ